MSNNIRLQPMYLQSGDPESENVTTLLYPGMIGGRLTVKEPGPPGSPTTAGQFRFKTYQLVQTDSSMSVAPFSGAVAWWSDKTKYLVTTSPTALGRGRIAGVFRNAITPGNFGCIQTQGPCPNVYFQPSPTASPTAAGLFVIPSATAGAADCLAAASAATYPALGVSTGVLGSNSQASVDLDVPETP